MSVTAQYLTIQVMTQECHHLAQPKLDLLPMVVGHFVAHSLKHAPTPVELYVKRPLMIQISPRDEFQQDYHPPKHLMHR